MLSKTCFYFKTDKTGYLLDFADLTESNNSYWLESLVILASKTQEAKEEIRTIDISDNVDQLVLSSENYDEVKQVYFRDGSNTMMQITGKSSANPDKKADGDDSEEENSEK